MAEQVERLPACATGRVEAQRMGLDEKMTVWHQGTRQSARRVRKQDVDRTIGLHSSSTTSFPAVSAMVLSYLLIRRMMRAGAP